MTVEATVRRVLDDLEAGGVEYMVVGSFASSYWGVPRSTNDGDLVVALNAAGLDFLVARLKARFYVPERMARDAVRSGGMFNVIDLETSAKVDLIVLGAGASARLQFARRRQGTLLGRPAWFTSPEDTILAKLAWRNRGGGDVHLRDCVGVARMNRATLDRAYLTAAAGAAGVATQLAEILAAADEV